MRKGDSTIVVMSVILLIIMIYIFSVGLQGEPSEGGEFKKEGSACYKDEDCLEHEDGNKCLLVYPGNLEPFCGCLTNADCDSDKYCSNNRCINL